MRTSTATRASGFTIVELLIVIVVLGILALIAYGAFFEAPKRARDASVRTDLKSAVSAIESIRAENGSYPSVRPANLPASPGSTYQYYYSPANDTYCINGTNSDSQFYSSNANRSAQPGRCPCTVNNGLRAEYFTNISFTGSPAFTDTASTINYFWSGAPYAGMPNDNYGVRWSGCVVAPETGTYTFIGSGDDGIRLTVNGVQLFDRPFWDPGSQSATISLTAGQVYDLTYQMFDTGGNAGANLSWQLPSGPSATIPVSALRY
ncbi:prepilin-type N-terminal cleavage/methylation domain-containing protein [Candidatus Saccharibacteria bacterium]|nr:prepilin-type N-terminal cleavage/methylation domain-containing protein [Candidatus Saccharibacteria bacterium]